MDYFRLSTALRGCATAIPRRVANPASLSVEMTALPAVNTDAPPCGDCCIPAFTRTVFSRSGRSALVRECNSTVSTNRLSTFGANERTRTGQERVSALLAVSHDCRVRKHIELRVLLPTFGFSQAVAMITESDKVFQYISLTVIIKQTKWFDVVNVQTPLCGSATLASLLVAFSRFAGYSLPIGSAIILLSTEPQWIIRTGPFWPAPPFCETMAGAKVGHRYRRWLPINFNSACVAVYDDTLPADTFPVNLLPSTVTGETAKRLFRLPALIARAVKYHAALRTCENNCFHTSIISCLGDSFKRAFRK